VAKEWKNTVELAFGGFFCAKIKPKLKRIQKTIRKQGFLMILFFNIDGFSKFTQIWLNLSATI
jgi:hypothetical protein